MSSNLFLCLFKKLDDLMFVIYGYKQGKKSAIFPYSFLTLLDPGFRIWENQDPGSVINLPDPKP